MSPGAIGIEAPPAVAIPTSQTYRVADELLATSQPLVGTMPPNRVCAVPSAMTVPLPSLAPDPATLITGKGERALTGVAIPPMIRR